MEIFAVLLIVVVALAVAFTVLTAVALVKAVFWLLFLPFKLLFFLATMPFRLAGGLLKVLGGLIALPVLLVVGVVGGGALVLAMVLAALVPLLPFLIVGGLLWAIVRSFRRPAAAIR